MADSNESLDDILAKQAAEWGQHLRGSSDVKQEQEHVLDDVPKGKGVLFQADGERTIVNGPFNANNLYDLLKCKYFQMAPAMGGSLAGKAFLIMDDEGKYNHPQANELASREVGDQVIGGTLHGNVLVCHPDDLE